MSTQIKRAWVSFASNLIIFGIYFSIAFSKFQAGSYNSEEQLNFWAATILILIPVMMAAKIVLFIIYSIVNTIATREKEEFLTDELDQLIELKSTRNCCFTMFVGFLSSIGSILIYHSPLYMLYILLFTVIACAITIDLTHFYLYRKLS